LMPGHIRRFPLGGQAAACAAPGEGVLHIAIFDEAARIDVNVASLPVLQALLAGLGQPPENAAALADAIIDYRDNDNQPRAQGAEQAEYASAGLGWPPKNAPFQSFDELGQVLGMTPALLEALRPHLGVHSGLAGIDPAHASSDLIGLLRGGWGNSAGAFGDTPQLHPELALPAIFVSASHRRVYSLTVQAATPSRAVYVAQAVVDLGARNSRGHKFLRWTRGSVQISPDQDKAEVRGLPNC
ncbi:MAG: general secretion pathway protein GspK, partial [Rhodomicrobium sp.]|nr:general secretion pathway protein GspK [Rhodomicrobium sp.]